MLQHLSHAHGVHLAAVVVAGLHCLLEVMSSNLRGQIVGDDATAALLLFHPGYSRHRDPQRAVVYLEADVDGVGMPGSDGYDVCLPSAMEVFGGPAVGDVEVFVHFP